MNLMTPTIDYSKMVNTIYTNPPTSHNSNNSGGDRIMRCAVYARVSTEMDSQKTSIENQNYMYRDYVSNQGWEIVEYYQDIQSGTKANRPGLKKLIADAKAGKFNVIISKELSRLARNGGLTYELKKICDAHHIGIICLDNSINSLEGNDQLLGLFAWVYEQESINSSRRNKAAKRSKAKRGLFTGSTPPFGYHNIQGKLFIREDQTPRIVQRIYSEYLDGKGMDSIAKQLTKERVPTPSQVAKKSNASPLWHATTIKNILNNRHYCGDLAQHKTETISVTSIQRKSLSEEETLIIEDIHEPIITREKFNAVKLMLQTRTRTNTAPKKHLFTNLFYCESCQKGMWYKANQKGYRCGGNIKHGDIYCTNRKVIREKDLKTIILKDLQELFHLYTDANLSKKLNQKLNRQKILNEKELLLVESNLNKSRSRKKNYVDLFADGDISKDELNEFREKEDQEIAKLEEAKLKCRNALDECKMENHGLKLGKKLEEISTLDDLVPKVLHSLVSKVSCSLNGDLQIEYTFVNPFEK